MLTLEQAKQRAFDRLNLTEGEVFIYREIYRYKAIRELPEDKIDEIYEELAERLGFCR